MLAWFILIVIVPTIRRRAPQLLLGVSAASLMFTMGCAVVYALSELIAVPLLTIPRMVPVHGCVNAFWGVLCAVLAWTLLELEETIERRPS